MTEASLQEKMLEGISLLDNFHYEAALKLFETLEKNNSDNIELLYNLAKTSFVLEKPKKAIAFLDRIIEKNQRDDYACYLKAKATFYFLEDYEKASNLVLKAIDFNAENSFYFSLAAQIFYSLKNYKRTIKLANDALNLNPFNFEAHLVLGNYYYIEKEHQKALEHFKIGLQNDQIDKDPFYQISIIHLDLAKTNMGQKLIKEACLNNPDNESYRWLYKYSFMRNQPLNAPFVLLENLEISTNAFIVFLIFFSFLVGIMYIFEDFCIIVMDLFRWLCSLIFILYLPYQLVVYIILNAYFHFVILPKLTPRRA